MFSLTLFNLNVYFNYCSSYHLALLVKLDGISSETFSVVNIVAFVNFCTKFCYLQPLHKCFTCVLPIIKHAVNIK